MLKRLIAAVLGVVAMISLFAGCHNSSSDAVAAVFDGSAYVGTWTGTWDNTTFASTGAGTVTVTFADPTLTLDLDLDGNIFGGANPPLESFTATTTTASATMDPAVSAVYGTLSGTLSATGTLTITGTSIPGAVDRFDFTGTWNATTITGSVLITFDSAATANAIMTFTKV